MAEINFRQATEADSATYTNWVNELGWDVSEDFYNAFRSQQPENAFVAEQDGEMIGHILIHAPAENDTAFIGAVVIREDKRKDGVGRKLLKHVVAKYSDRNIILEAPKNATPFYMKNDFQFFGTNPIATYIIKWKAAFHNLASMPPEGAQIKKLSKDVSIEDIIAYDEKVSGWNKEPFLRNWVDDENATCLVALKGGNVVGYICARKAHDSYRILPLYCDCEKIAEYLFYSLMNSLPPDSTCRGEYLLENKCTGFIKRSKDCEVVGTSGILFSKQPVPFPSDKVFLTSCNDISPF